jgi:imidazole glycerol phosphate synthase glutamine amidotransferase subunit
VIAILDYGAGNLRSVTNVLRSLAVPHQVVQDGPGLLRADKIILPGVGHFGQIMRALDAMQVRETLLARIRAGVPFLGICLGLQALFDSSEEAPEAAGLGVFPGHIRKFEGDMRVPHMGWSDIEPRNDGLVGSRVSRPLPSRLLAGLPPRPYVYFAHSYYAPVERTTSATCSYGGVFFTAALECENVFAIQFHAEKSGAIGRKMLQNFAGL